MDCRTGINLYEKAKKIIPGGTQLLSKRPEMFLPNYWPSYYQKAKGCQIWDLDGNKYIDMTTMGIGTCILGFADKDVNQAVKDVIDKGNMSTLNAPEDVELAELLCKMHPWAGMVRYARTGGEAMAISVRIARTKTQRDKILFCGYHGWHDWYLAANLSDKKSLDGHLLPGLHPKGVPRVLKGTSYPFKYNDTKSFLSLIKEHKKDIGVVVLETIRDKHPEREFLNTIRQVTEDLGIVLICDEITIGFRLNVGGAHLLFDFEPDIAVFGKALSNGYPMAAIIGKEEVMKAAQDSFISSTYWTDRIGPVSALATLKKIKADNVPKYLIHVGKEIQNGWKSLAKKYDINLKVSGVEPLSHFAFEYENTLVLKTLFTQLMLEKGFLASTSVYTSYSHKETHIRAYIEAVDDTFSFIARSIKNGNAKKYLKGPICHVGFKRLT
jgi:glutamate-1-semialdehyde aminotransferase